MEMRKEKKEKKKKEKVIEKPSDVHEEPTSSFRCR